MEKRSEEGFRMVNSWKSILNTEAKKLLLESGRLRGKNLIKIREDRKAMILSFKEAVLWLKGFIDGVIQSVRTVSWRNALEMERKRFKVELRRNGKGWFITISEYFSARKPMVFLPEGKKTQGWKAFIRELQHFLISVNMHEKQGREQSFATLKYSE
uniref:Uncharacterized protein n=1 Tax=Nelumbo nucifera TaxID=4432 RepID=A0A822XSF5_NELNU|nr:TPA_asm: hypothetical protein HUJ06_024086 [Nelumbo nucifera]